MQKSTESAIINNNIDELLEYATEKKAVQFTAYLLEYKESHFSKGKNVLDSLKLWFLSVFVYWFCDIITVWQKQKRCSLQQGYQKIFESEIVITLYKNAVKLCIDADDMKLVLDLEQFGVIKKNNIDELLEYATEKKAVQFSAYLLDKKKHCI